MASFLLSLLPGFAALSRSFPLIQVPNQCTHHPFLSCEFPDNSTFEHSLLLRFLHSSLFCYIISAGSFLVFLGSFFSLSTACMLLVLNLFPWLYHQSQYLPFLFPSLPFAALASLIFSCPFSSLLILLSIYYGSSILLSTLHRITQLIFITFHICRN